MHEPQPRPRNGLPAVLWTVLCVLMCAAGTAPGSHAAWWLAVPSGMVALAFWAPLLAPRRQR